MEKNLKVKVIKHKDVRGKELLYLIIENSLLINVGQKTFDAVKGMIVAKEVQQESEEDNEAMLLIDRQ